MSDDPNCLDNFVAADGYLYLIYAHNDLLIIEQLLEEGDDQLHHECITFDEVATAVRLRNALDKWIRQQAMAANDEAIIEIVNVQIEELPGL